jgi:hypothetical protein
MTSRAMVSLRVAATPKCAFEVFIQQIGIWRRPNPLFHFTPRSPGALAFEPGLGGRFTETSADGEAFEIGRIIAWEPGIRLAFTWRQATFTPEQITEVEVRFEPVDAETRVTVESRLGYGSPGACCSSYHPRSHFPAPPWGMVADPFISLPALPFRRPRACWRKS